MIRHEAREDKAKWKSLRLAIGVHIALVIALFVGVQWKSHAPAAVEVELWDSRRRCTPLHPSHLPESQDPSPKPEPKPARR